MKTRRIETIKPIFYDKTTYQIIKNLYDSGKSFVEIDLKCAKKVQN